MKKIIVSLLSSISCTAFGQMVPGESPQLLTQMDQKQVIQNRVLVKIGGKPVTVMDVVRRMDILFYQQFPQFVGNEMARFQFYSQNWRYFLRSVIDEQLVILDAKEKGVTVREGEVRRSMERVFGNEPILNITKAGLTYQEAYDLLEADLLTQKMNGGMVYQRALAEVQPKLIQHQYEKMVAENPPKEIFHYQVLSFRCDQPELSEALAEEASRALKEGKLSFEEVADQFSTASIKVTLSDDYHREQQELSLAHQKALQALGKKGISDPVKRKDVVYLFHLKDLETKKLGSFAELEKELQQKVLQEKVALHTEKYVTTLRERYGFSDKKLIALIPEDFNPFALL